MAPHGHRLPLPARDQRWAVTWAVQKGQMMVIRDRPKAAVVPRWVQGFTTVLPSAMCLYVVFMVSLRWR